MINSVVKGEKKSVVPSLVKLWMSHFHKKIHNSTMLGFTTITSMMMTLTKKTRRKMKMICS